ncbi:type IV pilus secretin PilQ [soil metagenome]
MSAAMALCSKFGHAGRRAVAGIGLGLAGLLIALPAAAQQTNAIESVGANQSGSTIVVRIKLKSPPKNPPAGFSVANPARVALDFPATGNASGQTTFDIQQGELRSANVVTVGDRSRLVLNLKRTMPYTTSIEGDTVVVALDGGTTQSGAPAGAPAQPVRFAEPAADAQSHSVRDIDFRRGRDGEGRIVVNLSDAQTGVDIRQQGKSIIVDFLKSSLPPELRRRLDVTDFGTPVDTVNTFTQGDNVRMVIEPKGLWEHNAYQSDTQFVVEVKAIKEDANKLFPGTKPGYQGERLSLNFQNIEVRAVLQVIADFTNINIITSETVSGNLTLRLRDVPWDQALDIVLQAKGLDMRKNGNVIWIAPRDELATKEKLDLEAKAAIADLEPIRTENFQLNYQKAADVVKIMGDDKQRMLSKRGSAVSDPRTNQIFVQDTTSKLEEIRRLIRQIDIATRQVLIEARIVEASDGFSRNLGVRLGAATRAQQFQVTGGEVAVGANGDATGGGSGGGAASGTIPTIQYPLPGVLAQLTAQQNFVNLPSAGLNGFNPGALAVTLFNSSFSRMISLELSALESEGKGRIISSPRVIAADQQRASIEDGEEIPYEQSTSSGATSIAFRKAVLKLDVTPQITPEGSVILTVNVNKDSRGVETRAGPAINTRNVSTQVLVENGGTVVIGGIYTLTDSSTTTKVPFLGDIPYLGVLFKNTVRVNNKAELLIFLTPRIIVSTVAGTQ